MPTITKRRVTMTGPRPWQDVNGTWHASPETTFTDYVREDFLDAYVADARTKFTDVTVSDEPDAGPAGYDGPTFVPSYLDHPLAGQFFPATNQE